MTTPWDEDLMVGEVDLDEHSGLLLAEDAAMKTYLSLLSVPERGEMVDVEVWFRFPEGERRLKYPFITIDFLDIAPSFERWTSQWRVPEDYCLFLDPMNGETISTGMYVPSTAPNLPEHSVEGTGWIIDPPLMHTLTYQIAVHARSALHDRYLMSRFLVDVFPPRPFFIPVDADMTWRRCELVDMAPADTTETTDSGNKRIFRKIYTVTMDAEIPISKIIEVVKARRIHIDVYPEAPPTVYEGSHAHDDPHTVAEPVTVEPSP